MSIKTSEMIQSLKKEIEGINLQIDIEEFGRVISIADGVAIIVGMEGVESGELVKFESGGRGLALNLEQDCLKVVLLDGENKIAQGEKAFRCGDSLKTPVGKGVLGRVINGLGLPIDGKGDLITQDFYDVESASPDIISRKSVSEPIYTGIKAIDTLIPIGRGQRELIIGDRQLGKTAIAIDTIINQKSTHKTDAPVYCIYVAIGQKCSNIAYIAKKLEEHGAMEYTTIVSTSASDSAAVQYLAPYFGCAIGEYFRDNGMHALVIYDDLSKHAVAYRQMSLLLKRPPGREAYPGDVFFIHSRLLERAAKLSDKLGGGSLTALPIVETQAGDISAYIPTNVISITDGQIFLEEELFYQGIRPAINLGLSVSRVGSAAQVKAVKQVCGKLKVELAQYRELKSFATFSSDVNDDTKKSLDYGERITESLKQDQYKTVSMVDQVITMYAQINNYAIDIPVSKIAQFQLELIQYIESNYMHIKGIIEKEQKITEEITALLDEIIPKFAVLFLSKINM